MDDSFDLEDGNVIAKNGVASGNGIAIGRSMSNGSQPSNGRKFEPMEIHSGEDEEKEDLESLLVGETDDANGGSSSTATNSAPKMHALQGPPQAFMCGRIQTLPIGNMQIFFPEYFNSSGWGVLGPQWFGPTCVWMILCLATHFCVNKAMVLGPGSVAFCFLFLAGSTYLLTDVSFRDPGICLHKEVPATVSEADANQWRWCDFCQVYQPPDGAHCPDCNVCIAGYDHHCVWMGTCIGRRNYRQFVRFNVSWLYYLAYLFFWLITFGPLFKG